MITKLFVDDFFNAEKTESSTTNEHENSSYKPSNILESKTNKTADLMKSLGRLSQSDDELLVASNNQSGQISECDKFSVVAVLDGRRLIGRRRSNL
jgi:hypothetical protein